MNRDLAARVRAVLFDFDGVLADTEDLHWAAFRLVAERFGVELSRQDYYGRYLGLPDRDCLEALLAAGDQDADERRLTALVAEKAGEYARLSATARVYPGVAEALVRLRRQAYLAVASGAFREEIEPVLDRSGVLPLFGAIVGAAEVERGKPAPDPFLRARAELERCYATELGAGECLVVEDSPRGLQAARAAGMPCVAITTSHSAEALRGADAILKSVAELQLPEDAGKKRSAPRR